jgi:hypothetical protein
LALPVQEAYSTTWYLWTPLVVHLVKKGLSGMKALSDALTEIKISITSLKSRASELELETIPALEKIVNEAIKIGEEVWEHKMIL